MKNLIVTADDFGLTKSINEGIVRACKEGIVSFLNFIPSGEAFEDALRLCPELKLKEIGAHLALTETRPVTDPSKIGTLVVPGGGFYKNHAAFLLKVVLKKINPEEIRLELKSQLEKLKRTGIPITNLSSHEHIHMVPRVLEIFTDLAKEYNIPTIRFPQNEIPCHGLSFKKMYKTAILSYFNSGIKKRLTAAAISYADNLTGFLDSGNMDEKTVLKILRCLKEGTTELVCHPGFLGPEVLDRYRFHMNCESELFALTSPRVKKAVKDNGISLMGHSEFLKISRYRSSTVIFTAMRRPDGSV